MCRRVGAYFSFTLFLGFWWVSSLFVHSLILHLHFFFRASLCILLYNHLFCFVVCHCSLELRSVKHNISHVFASSSISLSLLCYYYILLLSLLPYNNVSRYHDPSIAIQYSRVIYGYLLFVLGRRHVHAKMQLKFSELLSRIALFSESS